MSTHRHAIHITSFSELLLENSLNYQRIMKTRQNVKNGCILNDESDWNDWNVSFYGSLLMFHCFHDAVSIIDIS